MAQSGCYEGFSAPSVGETVWQRNEEAAFRTARVVSVDAINRVAQVEEFPAASAELEAAKAALAVIRRLREEALSESSPSSPQNGSPVSKPSSQKPLSDLFGLPVAPTNAFTEPSPLFFEVSPQSSSGSVDFPTEAARSEKKEGIEEAAREAATKAREVVFSKAVHSLPEGVPLSDLAPYRPVPLPPFSVPDDAACFGGLSAAALLQQLQHRYLRDEIYTSAARVLLAVNPYKPLQHLYSPTLIQLYRQWKDLARALRRGESHPLKSLLDGNGARSESLQSPTSGGKAVSSVAEVEALEHFNESLLEHGRPPPHPYVLAEEAYSQLTRLATNQTLIVTGQSGAGKTETSKQLMFFLTHAGVERRGSAALCDLNEAASLREKVLSCNAVFESLGNAATRRNYNSSRVGRLTRLHFGLDGALRGASLETFLLEAARLTSHVEGERTFHVFYELLAGTSSEQREKLQLTTNSKDFQMLRPTKLPQQSSASLRGSSSAIGKDEPPPEDLFLKRDSANFEALCASLRRADFQEEEIEEFLHLLAGLLHLSNVDPLSNREREDVQLTEKSDVSLAVAAKLLGVSSEKLQSGLLEREIRLRGEAIRSVRTPQQVAATRDALIRYIYTRIFSFLVYRMNCSAALRRAHEDTDSKVRAIGILDIYGFESFASGNGLEQLCINWANEKQQQLFVNQVIREEVDLFAQQGIAVPQKNSASSRLSPEEKKQQQLELRQQSIRSAVSQFRVSIQRSLIDALPNTASLLQQLQQGVFCRLDDACRLLAQGQNRSDSQLWTDVFTSCCSIKTQHPPCGESLGKVEPHVLFCLKGAQGARAVEAASKGELLHILKADQLAALGLVAPSALLGRPASQTAAPRAFGSRLSGSDSASAANKAREGLFAVQHFAGTVLYRTDGWIERNNDSVDESLEALLEVSSIKMLKDALAQRQREMLKQEGEAVRSGNRQSRFSSLTKHFLNSVKDLQVQLQDSNMQLHFIRCFVPNEQMAPDRFEPAVVLQQLLYSGTVALLHVLHCGFPHRLPLRSVAAELRSKLKVIQRRFQELLEKDPFAGSDANGYTPERIRLDVCNFDASTVRDSTLVTAAMSMIPECSKGAFQCGISLACFKSNAFRSASAFLSDPEILLRSPKEFVDLVGAIQRLRWKMAFRILKVINPTLVWLQRRAYLMRRIKEHLARNAYRIIKGLPIMRRGLLRARRSLALQRMDKVLLRASQRRGLRLWRRATDLAKKAEEASAAKAARLAAATKGLKALSGAGLVSVARKVASVAKPQPTPPPEESSNNNNINDSTSNNNKESVGSTAEGEAGAPSPKLDLSKLRPPEPGAPTPQSTQHFQGSPAWAFRLFPATRPTIQCPDSRRTKLILHAGRALLSLEFSLDAETDSSENSPPLAIRDLVCKQLADFPLLKAPVHCTAESVSEGRSEIPTQHLTSRSSREKAGVEWSSAALLTVSQHPLCNSIFVGCDSAAHLILIDLGHSREVSGENLVSGLAETETRVAAESSAAGFKRGSTGVPSVKLPALGGGWKAASLKSEKRDEPALHEYKRRFETSDGGHFTTLSAPLFKSQETAPQVRVIAPARWLPRDLLSLVRGDAATERSDGGAQLGFVRTLNLSFANPLTPDFVLVLCLVEHSSGGEKLVVVFVDLVEQRPLAWLPLFFAEPSLSNCRRKHAAFAESRLCVNIHSQAATESAVNSPCGTTRRAGRSRGKLLSSAFLQPLGGGLWLAAGPCLLSVFAVRIPQRPPLGEPSSSDAETVQPFLQSLWSQPSVPVRYQQDVFRASLGSLQTLHSLLHFAEMCPFSDAASMVERHMQRLLLFQTADQKLCLLEWKSRGAALGSDGISYGDLRVLGVQSNSDHALAFVRVFTERPPTQCLYSSESERLSWLASFAERRRSVLKRTFPWEPLVLRLAENEAAGRSENVESDSRESSDRESVARGSRTESTRCGEAAEEEAKSVCSQEAGEEDRIAKTQHANFLKTFEADTLEKLGIALVCQDSGELTKKAQATAPSSSREQASSTEECDNMTSSSQRAMHLAACAVPGHCDLIALLRVSRDGELELHVQSVSASWKASAKVALPNPAALQTQTVCSVVSP